MRYTDPTGKRRSITRRLKSQAMAAAERERQLLVEGRWTPPAEREAEARKTQQRQDLTVGKWVLQWLDGKRRQSKTSTVQAYERAIRNRITDVKGAPDVAKLATIPCAELTKSDVYEWWDAVTTRFDTPPTNRKAYVYLRAAFSEAVERDIVQSNPVFVKAAQAKPAPKEKELPETDDLQAILAEMPERYKLITVLFSFMGLRLGEALGLKREQIVNDGTPDAPRWVVKIRGNVQRVTDDDGHVYMKEMETPKTKAGWRDVPIFTEFNDIVQAHLDSFTGAPGDYLTTTETGAVVMDTMMRKIFARALERAGVKANLTPHCGRNWLITHMAMEGATPAEIGQVLGQSDLKTITETYMKVRDDRPRDVLNRVSGKEFGGSGDVIDMGKWGA
ncbi:tyrosine-type recombinase/integrase [Corynebacterium sp. 366]|uniref:tyrosine-type recombinase/integrase n=1 Tax=Corynebacterium sp. 366 TaxID=2652251 RepID=UPI0018656CF7|nr:tyrosine-type recombinase/integrase [Corynebacterium sp. 366]